MSITHATYCTREDVLTVLELGQSARLYPRIDRAISAATLAIDARCHRYFHPVTTTKSFTWPNPSSNARSWRLWVDGNDLQSVTLLESGGATIPGSDIYLEPQEYGPPYDSIEINTGTSAAFSSQQTGQRAISVTGVWGYSGAVRAAGALAASVAFLPSITVTNGADIGCGDLLLIDAERMIVTGRSLVTTGLTLSTPLTASAADRTVAVATPANLGLGEVITLDAEQMIVTDRLASAVLVERAVNGTVLATHTGSTIYAPRQLAVTRGANGSTATIHDSAATVSVCVVPALVHSLAVGEAIVELQQTSAGYARTAGSGDNERTIGSGPGLNDLRNQVETAYRRKSRIQVV